MNKQDKKLLDDDIQKRFDHEKQFVHDPDKRRSGSQTINLVIAVVMGIAVVGGLVYGLLSTLGWL